MPAADLDRARAIIEAAGGWVVRTRNGEVKFKATAGSSLSIELRRQGFHLDYLGRDWNASGTLQIDAWAVTQ